MNLTMPSRTTSPVVVPFTSVLAGDQCGWNHHGCIAIRQQSDLDWMWARFIRLGAADPKPTCDFATNMLICIFRGEFAKTGYITYITNVVDADSPASKHKFRWVLVGQFTPTAPPGSTPCYPYHIVQTTYIINPIRPVYYWVLTDPRV